MPTYDYRCNANGRTVEVRHGMKEKLATWGEVCARAGIALGDTPAAAPVERLATGGNVVRISSIRERDLPPCAQGGTCDSCSLEA